MDWSYGGSTKPPNLPHIQSLQSKILRKITNTPFYVSNLSPPNNLHVLFVKALVVGTTNSIPSLGTILITPSWQSHQ